MARRYICGYHLDGLGNGGSGFSSNILTVDARPSFHPLLFRFGLGVRNASAATHQVKYDPSTVANANTENLRSAHERFFIEPLGPLPSTDQEVWSLDTVGTGSSGTDALRLYYTTLGELKLYNDGGGGSPKLRWQGPVLEANRK